MEDSLINKGRRLKKTQGETIQKKINLKMDLLKKWFVIELNAIAWSM